MLRYRILKIHENCSLLELTDRGIHPVSILVSPTFLDARGPSTVFLASLPWFSAKKIGKDIFFQLSKSQPGLQLFI